MPELIMYNEYGKPVFSDQYLEIEKDFLDVELVTVLGEELLDDDIVHELDPEFDLGGT